jgi:cytochrome c oxidase accessory protein FixG
LSAAAPEPLFVAHQKIYPREINGRFNRLRVAVIAVLFGLFYALPWLHWDGHQAILFDLPARRFNLFGLLFFPQDFFFLSWLLLIAALSLFFFTAIGGRLWCGFACPQTVWTQAFIWMERLTEGNRSQQIKLDKAPWTLQKIFKKSAKQFLWISFSAYTGFTFVAFFTPANRLISELTTLSLGGWETFWIVFYGFATYGNAGYLREQVCKYMCPYARFQSAMFDRHTLIITYDTQRGEPRGSRGRGAKKSEMGDCVDCTLCVQVCPTGIDIRKGLQYECIACTACVDACDSIMDKMEYPRGLIRYSTQAALEGKPNRIVRPRTIVYATLLLVLIAGFGYGVTHRNLVDLDVLRDRNSLYRRLNDGSIENVYSLRLINKDFKTHDFKLRVNNLADAVLETDGSFNAVTGGEVRTVTVRVRVPPGATAGNKTFEIAVEEPTTALAYRATTRFIVPSGQ